jgi:coenzyme F420-dependent glucose-6-phosphate dehydrogenase
MLMLGYKAATEQFGPSELLDYAVEAENAGFDGVMASDHFHPWRNDDVECFDVWSWFGALGVRTKKIGFGSGVTCPTIRHNPAVIAQAAATLGSLFPGRFWLGLGSGEAINELSTTGLWPDQPDRYRSLVEAIEIIRRLWAGEHLTYRGEYFQTRDAHVYVPLSQPVPLHIAAWGLQTARKIGRYGDGWITTGPPDALRRDDQPVLQAIESGATAVGRDPSKIDHIVEVKVIYAQNREQAIQDARLWAATSVPNREKYGMYDPRDLQQLGSLIPDDQLENDWFSSADPDEHADHALGFIQKGFNHLYFHNPSTRQREFIEFYGKEVLPRIRQKVGGKQVGAGGERAA